eukprot:CAMPEP_0171761028 /NCGR_PEP_ID=MMETSP0991-20121206/47816_1 /TAXON_ID=483369 /ORGANISM="non described non described, Strain CCMP2098" /LENGTH=62 /DNA_ID=CAMNT_0012364221 /DNA_START=70 /DNA_END=258 /DNA_ORIENTATION=-
MRRDVRVLVEVVDVRVQSLVCAAGKGNYGAHRAHLQRHLMRRAAAVKVPPPKVSMGMRPTLL